MNGFELEPVDANHLKLAFQFVAGGQQSTEHIALERVAASGVEPKTSALGRPEAAQRSDPQSRRR